MDGSILTQFENDCLYRDFTKRTIETYRSNVRYFLDFSGYKPEITIDDLTEFLAHLRQRKLTPSTLNGYFAAINAFYDYLIFTDMAERNPVPTFRRRYLKHKRRFNYTNTRQLIGIEKMSELVKEPLHTEPTNIKNYIWTVPIRDQAIFMVFAKTGIRKTENQMIEVNETDIDNGEIWIKPFPKRTNCMAFIDDETIRVLKDYLDWRDDNARPNNKYLWTSHTGANLRKDDLYYLTTHYSQKIGIHDPDGMLKDKFTPHCFRHWFTTHLRRSGMSREYRKWLRGDAPEGADDLYDHIDPEEVREGYLKHIPKLID